MQEVTDRHGGVWNDLQCISEVIQVFVEKSFPPDSTKQCVPHYQNNQVIYCLDRCWLITDIALTGATTL